jgi:membrane-bound serine protease (ClpP class)
MIRQGKPTVRGIARWLACLLTLWMGLARAQQPAPTLEGKALPVPAVPSPALDAATPPPVGRNPVVVQLEIDGGITQVTADLLEQALAEADRRKAQALVVSIDTPGGLLEATRRIVHAILVAPVPVIAYVAPAGARAASAGTFLVLASHVAAMHPVSSMGAAHPVGAFGSDIEGTMKDKVVNDTAAWARSLAQSRGRNSEWAERAVRESSSITASEALPLHAVDLLAGDLPSLLEQAEGKVVAVQGSAWRVSTGGTEAVRFEPSFRQSLLAVLAHPAILYLLLLAGALGLYVEFTHPGLILPGLFGVLCLGIVFGLQVLPMNGVGLLLIGAAALLFIAEIYVTSLGLLTVAGLACLIGGSYLLFDVPGSPFRLHPLLIWGTAFVFAGSALGVGYLLLRVRRQGATSGPEAWIGAEARVVIEIPAGGRGKIFFDGAYWDATSSERLEPGAPCRVDAVHGLLVSVSPWRAEQTRQRGET